MPITRPQPPSDATLVRRYVVSALPLIQVANLTAIRQNMFLHDGWRRSCVVDDRLISDILCSVSMKVTPRKFCLVKI